MDDFTNNTSLVLAIELTDSGKVLLFPGDAQFGNWNSWDSVKFATRPNVTAADLLARAVFYKVGHHASHNATLRKRGLERMVRPDLVAMIPVDQSEAKKKGPKHAGGWKMPYPALYDALKAQTRGRILRADEPAIGKPQRPDGVTDREWSEFEKRVKRGPKNDLDLYVELTIPDTR
jgi:hypothetical protein